ncbi:PepSY domain-containing protein [Pseudoflavonifractor hominis]|uniref:PepSY domain-containing protein n=1 Tax=Pseudoflavonifractor hominis TaxID=2763059 RepID=A0ABR7HV85_9FIRM|nr:PepSY domain-containing protein [Pseudoflavonifractor hominis]MBC5731336.1 PepSY domain-containing protein [Pseudoflavonifractor hominis]
MMKQNRWKKSVAALTMAGVLALGMAAGAAVVRQKITAELRPDITVKVNGKVQDLDKDAISYNGSTYLPVRAIGEAVGMDVNWDSSTQTVSLDGASNWDDVDAYITLANAKTIALEDAGLSASKVTFTKAESGWDDGRPVYDVEFTYNGKSYDYEICAWTGNIISRDGQSWNDNWDDNWGNGNGNGNYIGMARAKTIALEDAGLSASKVTFTKTQGDWDDGRKVYDIEFVSGSTKYEYEIAAATGTVLKREHESWSGGTSSSTAIGVEKAKTIALNDAGLSASQVTFTKAQTDWDDGRMEYDVEFRSGGIEYEYEIDAYSGAILSRDVDRD